MAIEEYFRVINYEVNYNTIFDTKTTNYGIRSRKYYKLYEPICKKIIEIDKKYNYNTDIYVSLYKKMLYEKKQAEKYDTNWLKVWLNSISHNEKLDKINDNVPFSMIVGNNYYGDATIKFEDLLKIANELVLFADASLIMESSPPYMLDECLFNRYLFEVIFEEERKSNFQDLPSRLESYFIFKDIETCKNYIRRYGGHIVKVIPQEFRNHFEGDMSILDTILYDSWATLKSKSIPEYLKTANQYWSGEKTNRPFNEVLFQGAFKIEEYK